MGGYPLSLTAGADLSAKQYYLVKITSRRTVTLCGDGYRVDGILLNKPTSGHAATVETNSGVEQFVIAGGSFSAGAELASDASGKAVTALSGDESFGVALEDASGDGSQVRVMTRFRSGLTG